MSILSWPFKSKKVEVIDPNQTLFKFHNDSVRVDKEPSGNSLKGLDWNLYKKNSDNVFIKIAHDENRDLMLVVAERTEV